MALLKAPSAKQLEVILSELGENEGMLEKNVEDLKTWIRFQPHLPNIVDNQLLKLYVRGCKHDRMRARSKLEAFCIARAMHPEFYDDRDYHSTPMKEIRKLMDVVALPRLTEDGCRVTIFRFKKPEGDAVLNVVDAIKYIFALVDVRMREESAMSGDVFVWDVVEVTGAHIARIANPAVRRALMLATKAYPQRLRRLHVLRAPPYLHTTVALLRSLATEKIRKRFISHQSIESLHQYISPAILPSDYSGQEDSLDNLSDVWNKRLQQSKSYLDSLQDYKAVCDQPIYTTGLEGSFRKLDID